MATWYLIVAASAFFTALGNIIRKHVLNHEHALEQLAASAPFRLVIILAIAPFITRPSWKLLAIIFTISVVLVTVMVYRNKSYRHLPISTAAPMMNLSPVFLLVLSVLLLGERPAWVQVGGIALVMIGGYMLELKHGNLFAPFKKMGKSKYTGVLITTLVLLSIMAMLDKTFLSQTGIEPLTYLFWLYLFLAINSVAADWLLYDMKGVKEDLRKGWVWLFAATILQFISVLLLYKAFAMPGVLVALAIPIRRTATLIETLLGGSLFHEKGVWRKAAGCLVMVAGVVLIV